MLAKTIKSIAFLVVFAFPLVYIQGFAFPGIFPRAMLAFFVLELLFFLFIWHLLSQKEIVIKKSYLTASLFLYIVLLFVSALLGPDLGQSFWSSFFRMTGIITWLHYLSFLVVLATVFTSEKDWRNIFRAILLSGFVLALVSYLGVDGLNTGLFSGIKEGGSLFGNTSYSGAYYLLVFFLSLVGFTLESSKVWKGVYVIALFTIFFNPDLFSFQSVIGMARASALVLWGGVLTLLILFLIHRFTNKKFTIIAFFSILFLISGIYAYSFISLIKHQGKIHDVYLAESGPARPLVWDMAVEGIKSRPFFGYGPENFNYVFQEHLNPKIIKIEKSTEWFDNVHNFTLAEILDAGIIGATALLLIFILVVFTSLKLYLLEKKFYFLIIPFILVFHFLQMQTFFQTDSALFLIFILIAFLISHKKNMELKMPLFLSQVWPKVLLIIIFITSSYFFVYVPMKENLLISEISKTTNRALRLSLYQNLCCLKVYPIGILRLLSGQFVDSTAPQASMLKKAGVAKNVAEEYVIYLEAYERYLPRYKNNYRYLFEYANLINYAFIFDVNRLERGEELARKSLEMSRAYPHPFWVLAMNLYYQGRIDEALLYAKYAYDLDPEIDESKEIYETLKASSKFIKK